MHKNRLFQKIMTDATPKRGKNVRPVQQPNNDFIEIILKYQYLINLSLNSVASTFNSVASLFMYKNYTL